METKKETKIMSKQEAIQKCLYGIIWWVGPDKWNQELGKNVLEELEELYDAASEAGKE